MPTVVLIHEVDDMDHWLAAPTRDAVFGPAGITHRTFVDPENPNRVGLIVDVPAMEAFHELIGSAVAAEAMKTDGVRPDTLVTLIEG
jgi:hypothetical protein